MPPFINRWFNFYKATKTGAIESPQQIANLQAWFDADSQYVSTTGTTVNSWTSRVNNYQVSNTGSFRPTYTTNAVNGKPVVRFNDANTEHLKAEGGGLAALASGSADFTVFAVYKHDAGTGGGAIIDWHEQADTANTETVLVIDPSSTFFAVILGGGSSAVMTGPTIIRDEFTLQTTVFGSGVSHWRQRGDGSYTHYESKGTKDHADNDAFAIGYRPRFPGQAFDGDIAEILIYNRELTPEEVETVENYLLFKYFHPSNFDGILEWFKAEEGVQE